MCELKQNQNAGLVTISATPNTSNLAFNSLANFELAQRMAMCLQSSSMLPKQYCGRENVGNCIIALELAWRAQLPIMDVMQNLYVVNGKPAWSATFLIGRIMDSTHWTNEEWEQEKPETPDWRMRFKATRTADGKQCVGSWVSLKMARDEHWGAKWQTMPEQMLKYRSAAFWVRQYDPNIAMSIRDQYEIEDAVVEEIQTEHETKSAPADPEPANPKPEKEQTTRSFKVEPKATPEPIVKVVVEPKKPQKEEPKPKENPNPTEIDFEEAEQTNQPANGDVYKEELQRALKNLGIRPKPEQQQ